MNDTGTCHDRRDRNVDHKGTLKPSQFQAIGDLVPSIEWLGIASTAPDDISTVDHVKC